jgi:hypothetical protein
MARIIPCKRLFPVGKYGTGMEKISPGYSVAFRTPVLTRKRMWAAMAVAVIADGLQLALGPLGIAGFDQGIDLVAAVLSIGLLGFHPLLLPTFLIELIPVADLLPTWTGCIFFVIAMRRRAQAVEAPPQVIVQPPEVPDKRA